MRGEFPTIELTEEQEEDAARIEDVLNAKGRVVNRYLARLLASKPNRELFGETEFQVRDAVHRLGAEGIDAALHERKKRGTAGPASSAPGVGTTRSFTATGTAE